MGAGGGGGCDARSLTCIDVLGLASFWCNCGAGMGFRVSKCSKY